MRRARRARRNPTHVVLTAKEQAILQRLLADKETPTRLERRARIVLLASGGLTTLQIAFLMDLKRPVVKAIIDRFYQTGVEGMIREHLKPKASKKVAKSAGGEFAMDSDAINLAATKTVHVGDMLVFIYVGGVVRLFRVADRYAERGRAGGVMLDLVDVTTGKLTILTDMPQDVAMVRKVRSKVEMNPLEYAKEGTMIVFLHDTGEVKVFYLVKRTGDKVVLTNVVTDDELTLFSHHVPKRVTLVRSVMAGINVRSLRKLRELRTGERRPTRMK